MIIIGLSGKKRSGKDTFTDYAQSILTCPTERMGFADALYEEVAKACGVTVEHIREHKARYRAMLQWWGTDFRRVENGDDYWIKQLLSKLSKSNAEIIFVTDVRFKNEASIINDIGTVIRIERDMCDNSDLHQSEIDLDDWKFDHVMQNNDTIEIYHKKIRTFLQSVTYQQNKLCLKQ